jgi:cold shock CspA family protein
MADVFISYAQEDRHLTEALASYLEGLGYSVWWDTRLVSGDEIDEVIAKAIDDVQAAIVIWTPNSIGSRWVKSEAIRADGQHKLIPVRVPELDAKKLPLPFNTKNTELLGDREKIRAALLRRGVAPRASAGSPKPRVQSVRLVKLGREVVEAVQDGFGRSIARSGKPNPSTADIVAANPKPIADTVLAIHKEVWSERTTVFGVPLANGEKNLLWPHLREMLTNPLAHFGDKTLFSEHVAWWEKHGSAVVMVVNTGRLHGEAEGHDEERPADPERVKDLLKRYEALKAPDSAGGCDTAEREPRGSEVRLANCVARYVQAWLADGELAKLLKGRPPTMQQLLSPPKDVRIEVERGTVAAPGELARRMRWLYTDYAEHRELAKDGVYPCILPLINPDVRTNPAVTTLREVANNLHRAFEPAAAPIRVAVRFVQARPATGATQQARRERQEHAKAGKRGGGSDGGSLRINGVVRSFDLQKGIGFIQPEGGAKDVPVDWAAVVEAKIGPLEEGMRVTFELGRDEQGPLDAQGRPQRKAVRVRPR